MKTEFICPDGFRQPVQECFKSCRMAQRCAPLTYLRQVGEQGEWKGRVSCTQLLRGARDVWLSYTTPWADSPDRMAFMTMGSAGHIALENAGKAAEYVVEGWVHLDGIIGRFDFIEPNEDGPGCFTLIDYKVVGSYAVAKAMGLTAKKRPLLHPDGSPVLLKTGPNKGKPKMETYTERGKGDLGDYSDQENFYRVAFNHEQKEAWEKRRFAGLFPDQNDGPKRVTRMKLFMIVRDGGTMIAENRGVLRNTYYFDVPLVDDAALVEKFRANKAVLLEAFEKNPDASPEKPWPSPCSEVQAWGGNKCKKYCPVMRACVLHGDNPWIRVDQLPEMQIDDGVPSEGEGGEV